MRLERWGEGGHGRLVGPIRESDLHPKNNGKHLERSNQLAYLCICTDTFCLQNRKQIEGWIGVGMGQPARTLGGGVAQMGEGAVNRVVL